MAAHSVGACFLSTFIEQWMCLKDLSKKVSCSFAMILLGHTGAVLLEHFRAHNYTCAFSGRVLLEHLLEQVYLSMYSNSLT